MGMQYDKEIEITKKQYDVVIREFTGIIAHRQEGDKFFIKLWFLKFRKALQTKLLSLS